MCGLPIISLCNPTEGMGDCFHFHRQAEGCDRIGCNSTAEKERTEPRRCVKVEVAVLGFPS